MTTDRLDRKPVLRSRRFAHRSKTGCLTCRSRRVKCDERKPLCVRCYNAGYECRGIEYADSVPTVVGKASSPQGISTRTSPTTSISPTPGYVAQFDASNDVLDILYLAPWKTAQVSANTGFGQLATIMRAQCESVRTYIEFLPSLAGHDVALDSAIACVANALRYCYLMPLQDQGASQSISPTPSSPDDKQATLQSEKSLALYARALKNLQDGLNDPQRSLRVELLLAAILLLYFEAIYGYTETGIIAHADGASKLIQHRGPHRFTTVLEKRLLTSQYSLIVTSALFLGKSIYLNTPDWISVLKSSMVYSESAESDGRRAMEYLIASMTALDLLAAIAALATDKQLTPTQRTKRRVALLEKLFKAQQDYDGWRRTLEMQVSKKESKFTLMPENTQVPINGYSDFDAKVNIWFWSEAGVLLLLRLHVALGGDDSHAVELKAQRMANHGMAYYEENRARVRQQTALTFLLITNAVLATAEEWAAFSIDGEGKLAETGMLFRWLTRMGVQSPPVSNN